MSTKDGFIMLKSLNSPRITASLPTHIGKFTSVISGSSIESIVINMLELTSGQPFVPFKK